MMRRKISFLVAALAILILCGPGRAGADEQADAQQLTDAYAAYLARDFATAHTLLAPLADKGNVDAQAQLGTMYLLGNFVKQDPRAALTLFEAAAAQGSAKAQLQIGGMYQSGSGVPKDPAKAVIWVERAAAQSYGPAESALGRTYEIGFGVDRDFAKALALFQRAADKGQFNGQAGVGRLLLRGQGAPRDLVGAHMWLTLASRHRHPNLARMMTGVLQDIATAESEMTASELAEAQSRAASWQPVTPCRGDECFLLK